MNDLPPPVERYDFLRNSQSPGEQFPAIKQCQQSFGATFIPHVKPGEKPFDVKTFDDLQLNFSKWILFQDLCRELWCSNDTHALRAHPALEGTDCSAKPYPFGSVRIEKYWPSFKLNNGIGHEMLLKIDSKWD